MFAKVLLATDLSPAWDEIINCAGELKVLGARELILAHVITVRFLGGFEERLRAEAAPKLAAAAERLRQQGFDVCTELVSGLPGLTLAELADRYCVDLVLVGPQKVSRWQERILGSVTSAVLHRVRRPLLLLRPLGQEAETMAATGSCRLQARELLRQVLLPTDFSPASEQAAAVAAALADRGLQQVVLLHALDVPGGEAYPPGFQELAEAQAKERLAATAARLRQAGIAQVETVFDPGRPVPAILAILSRRDISLIIMGTHGKGFIKEVFLGSVAHNVARLAPVPLLLVPAGEERQAG